MALVLAASFCILGASTAAANGGDDDDRRDRESAPTNPARLRSFIDRQVGGLQKLMVPENDADLPQPRNPDGTPVARYVTTEAKRYLGKQLFHDPVRAVRIVPTFGGVPETSQTASCGSCHFGEVGSKAGTVLNFAAGGEGIGYTDARGRFTPRRRPRTDLLPQLRRRPLFPGDALVDELPTLTDVYRNAQGVVSIGSPALGQLNLGDLVATGRLDALDSVGRMAPSVLGFAFNNRLLLDGFAGEDDATDGGLNPFNDPAQENLTLLLLDAHRMIGLGPQGPRTQSQVLQSIPAYRKLFREAFPAEAAQADAQGNLDLLVNDETVFRATATFLRTVVTRNTPWDRFLAGDDRALTPAQRRGAALFFSDARGGAGGAGCYSCHSGPMLNKQWNDPDVTGVGQFVDENFHNVGLTDHPVQALARAARDAQGQPGFRDRGREDITRDPNDAFEFRTLTLRQIRDSRTFLHNASFSSVRDVVEYFNAGVPQDREAGTASTISRRFTNPRGPSYPRGLGLSRREVDDITDFIENALFDPAFVAYDPWSSTDTFQLNERDVTYSRYRRDLAALGVVDGLPISGLGQDNNDPLSRRDQGLEFLDVTADVDATRTSRSQIWQWQTDTVRLRNDSSSVVDTHLLVVVRDLPNNASLLNATGYTKDGDPYIRLFLEGGVLEPRRSVPVRLVFGGRRFGSSIGYDLTLLSGQGEP